MPGLLLPTSLPRPSAELQSLAQSLLQLQEKSGPKALASLLTRAAAKHVEDFLDGVERYRHHPYRRESIDVPVIWQEGSSRLLDYGGSGPAVLFAPSLINRAYILDLNNQRSLLRWLKAQGLRPLLLDWGQPGESERRYNLASYTGRLERAINIIGQPIHLAGYCMGGNIALQAALSCQPLIRSLTFLATPWDFHADNRREQARHCTSLYQMWRPACEASGLFPVDLIQALFTLLDPHGPQDKFRHFAHMTDIQEIENFVGLEDWVNDGVPLALGAADDCLLDWFGNNALTTRLSKQIHKLAIPSFVITPEHDHIVPPSSAEALALSLPLCMRQRVPLGHVGMIVSRTARQQVWEPLADWLHTHHYYPRSNF